MASSQLSFILIPQPTMTLLLIRCIHLLTECISNRTISKWLQECWRPTECFEIRWNIRFTAQMQSWTLRRYSYYWVNADPSNSGVASGPTLFRGTKVNWTLNNYIYSWRHSVMLVMVIQVNKSKQLDLLGFSKTIHLSTERLCPF